MSKSVAILGFENVCEGTAALPDGCHLAAADDVRPQGDLGACNVSPKNVQALVPGVERLIVRAFEARPTDVKDLNVIAEGGLHDMRRHVCGVRDALSSEELAPKRRGMWAHGRTPA